MDSGFPLEFTPYLSIRPDHGIPGENDISQTLMLVGQRTSWISRIHEEMIAEVPRNREKSENVFHFYSIPSLLLPSGERGSLPAGRQRRGGMN